MNLILTLALKAYHLLWIPGKIGDVPDYLGLSRMIVIVGAGLGGTATAIRLLQFAREPAEIVVIERRSEYRNAGPAYHRDSNHWHHVFNIQAGRHPGGSTPTTWPTGSPMPPARHRRA